MGYFLANEGELPQKLRRERAAIPTNDIVVISLFSLLIANTIELTEIAIIGSAGFLLIFAVVNMAALKLASEISASRVIVTVALLFSSAALVVLLLHTWSSNPMAIGVFFCFIGSSILFELLYGRLVRGHFFRRAYDS